MTQWKCGLLKRMAMSLFLSIILLANVIPVQAGEDTEPQQLYAQSAVLMDADSGRVLFSKEGDVEKAMASTTKIMTCILALEEGVMQDVVTASSNAAKQPRVRLGVQEGEQILFEDLLYALMLESYNDAAVMIAEHIGGSVEGFAKKMNQKAMQLRLSHTYFITPSGLDAQDENGSHHTTAKELALIMKYCIMDSPKANEFLQITGTASHTFSNLEKTKNYSCTNHNAFLQMMDGAFSGKTGFTGDAGYCYVGALRNGERTFISVVLGCGWPNNKNYKWVDTKKLMQYGIDYFQYKDVWKTPNLSTVVVENGISDTDPFSSIGYTELEIEQDIGELQLLLAPWEEVEVKEEIPKQLKAPVTQGDIVGSIQYLLQGDVILELPIMVKKSVSKINFQWFFQNITKKYFLGC
ncbi:MAG: D-alanyl-D-alanine carboxypeptidase [Candidatus Ruminococcus intestinipullorum]|nr:D-alanyl-D-alanine carboxypeptidase [Candidatus Ruminococcus intestinipullorum]